MGALNFHVKHFREHIFFHLQECDKNLFLYDDVQVIIAAMLNMYLWSLLAPLLCILFMLLQTYLWHIIKNTFFCGSLTLRQNKSCLLPLLQVFWYCHFAFPYPGEESACVILSPIPDDVEGLMKGQK